ncbi:MAG: GMC family oxidoreductase [Minicystis sp.]
MSQHFDYIIVGAGFVGAVMARYLGQAGYKVLVLDAGSGLAGTPAAYDGFVENFYTQLAKVPNSAYPNNPNAPSPSVLDITQNVSAIQNGGWLVPNPLPTAEKQAQWFGSDYLRMVGGTGLHWLGTCLRMLPNDFRMKTLYGRGVDWPIGYDDLEDDYGNAEWEIGVSADKDEQEYLGIHFPAGYEYPMRHIPPTVVSQTLSRSVNGMKVRLGHGKDAGEHEVRIISTPQGRNSMPIPGYTPRGRVRVVRYADHPEAGQHGRPAGAIQAGERGNARAYFEHIGERCEGNSSCIPICPVQAKYNPIKTMAWALRTGNVEVWPQHVVTRVLFGADGNVTGLEYKHYPSSDPKPRRLAVTAGRYVLALNSIENAKLMLASYAEDPRFRDENSQLGKNLMDHPFVLTWGESEGPLGTYRAPSSTAGIETLRDGAFRAQFGAFRIEVGNWGWDLPIGNPYTTTANLINGTSGSPLFGQKLRDELRLRLQRQVRFGALIEQLPDQNNRVEVSPEWKDSLGEYRPVIHYGFTEYEIQSFAAYKSVSDAVFTQAGVKDRTDWNQQFAGQRILVDGKPFGDYKWMGAGHLVGTHRMARSPEDGVVDTYQQSFVHKNLIMAGAGSMCTIGTSNPTLTLTALTFRTLRHLLGSFKTEAPVTMGPQAAPNPGAQEAPERHAARPIRLEVAR